MEKSKVGPVWGFGTGRCRKILKVSWGTPGLQVAVTVGETGMLGPEVKGRLAVAVSVALGLTVKVGLRVSVADSVGLSLKLDVGVAVLEKVGVGVGLLSRVLTSF